MCHFSRRITKQAQFCNSGVFEVSTSLIDVRMFQFMVATFSKSTARNEVLSSVPHTIVTRIAIASITKSAHRAPDLAPRPSCIARLSAQLASQSVSQLPVKKPSGKPNPASFLPGAQ